MMIIEFAFWISIFLVLYTYVLYPVILRVILLFRETEAPPGTGILPTVSMIIPVYNEEGVIRQKLENCGRIDYPAEKLEILFGSDSDDGTDAVVKEHMLPNMKFMKFEKRMGKSFALLKLIEKASGDIIVFSDANTFYNPYAVKNLVRHFTNPKIGGVCGRLILVNPNNNVGGWGESRYWQYENYLKQLEGMIYTTVGATGGIYAIRYDLVSELPVDRLVSDDLVMALLIAGKGYRVVYDRDAVAIEATTKSIEDEFIRKKRIGIGNFQALKLIAHCLNPRRGFVAFALWSHKIIRWFSPVFIITALISTIFLLGNTFYNCSFVFQVLFYLFAFIGWFLGRNNKRVPVFSYPLYFVTVHFALLVSLLGIFNKTHEAHWEQTKR